MASEHKPKRRWGKWVALSLALLILLLVGGHWNWGVSADKRLKARVELLRAQGEPMLPEDFRQAPVPEAENFVVDIRAAAKLIDGSDPVWQAFNNLEVHRLPLTDRERQIMAAATERFAESLRRIRGSRHKTGVDWGLSFSAPMITTLLPDLSPTRQLASLIAGKAIVAHAAGDDAEAIESLRDVLAIGRAVERVPFLVGHLVAVGVSSLAWDRAGQIAPGLKVGSGGKAAAREQVQALIAELLDEKPVSEGQRLAYRGERAAQLDTMRRLHSGELSFNAIAGGAPGGSQALQSTLGYALKPLMLSEAELMVSYMTHVIGALDKPTWPAYQVAAPNILNRLGASPIRHPFSRMLLPSLDRAAERHYQALTERRMAAIALALRLYAHDHGGKLPAKLDELVPAYLPALPLDPMAAEPRPFGYKPDGERPMLYSVGPNGTDDSGHDEPVRKRPGTDVSYGRWERLDAILDLRLRERPKPDEEPEAQQVEQ